MWCVVCGVHVVPLPLVGVQGPNVVLCYACERECVFCLHTRPPMGPTPSLPGLATLGLFLPRKHVGQHIPCHLARQGCRDRESGERVSAVGSRGTPPVPGRCRVHPLTNPRSLFTTILGCVRGQVVAFIDEANTCRNTCLTSEVFGGTLDGEPLPDNSAWGAVLCCAVLRNVHAVFCFSLSYSVFLWLAHGGHALHPVFWVGAINPLNQGAAQSTERHVRNQFTGIEDAMDKQVRFCCCRPPTFCRCPFVCAVHSSLCRTTSCMPFHRAPKSLCGTLGSSAPLSAMTSLMPSCETPTWP